MPGQMPYVTLVEPYTGIKTPARVPDPPSAITGSDSVSQVEPDPNRSRLRHGTLRQRFGQSLTIHRVPEPTVSGMPTTLYFATLSSGARGNLFTIIAAVLVFGFLAALALGLLQNVVTKLRDDPRDYVVGHTLAALIIAAIAWIWLPTGTALLIGAGVSLAALVLLSP